MSPMDWIGATLGGRYLVQELIGRGGMSSVYKALDPNLQRVVAIKMIHPHMSGDPKFTARFEDEARAVARLRHSNIVQVYDFNHDGDTFYMVQEFVPGETVQDLLNRLNMSGMKISPLDAARYTAGVCSAIDYAHNLGMIHRDIKPANIMIDERGQAILMDFGIVKLLQGDSHTTTGTIVGTISYMSPDLIRGEPPDARSDIYSLGVTLYEMLTGELPFKSDSAVSLMMMVQNNEVPDLHMLRSDLPEELVAIVKKSLAKTRAERYSTAAEMGTALNRMVHSLTGSTTMRIPPSGATAQADSAQIRAAQAAEASTPAGGHAGSAVEGLAGSPTGGSAELVRQTASAATGATPPPAGASPPPAGNGAAPMIREAAAGQAPRRASLPIGLMVGMGALLVIFLLAAGFLLRSSLANRRAVSRQETLTARSVLTQQAAAVVPTLPVAAPTQAPGSSATSAPAVAQVEPTGELSATVEFQPTPTALAVLAEEPQIPTDIPFIRIASIEIDDQDRYVVDYEILNPELSGRGDRLVFYFNSTPRTSVGEPQAGFYVTYTEEPPFTGYKTIARPRYAVEMCGLVASIQDVMLAGSGNCFPLPEVTLVTAESSSFCRYGPGEEYPIIKTLQTGYSAAVEGISPDESWWYVRDSSDSNSFCWVPAETTELSGDIAQIGLVQPPPLPSATPMGSALSVEIVGITVDEQNRYAVEYVTHNYVEGFPGMHMHFFFDTTPPNQAGIDGGAAGHLMYGGPTPFTGYSAGDRPPGASQMCALVANPDHSVIFEPISGNFMALPEGS